MKLIYSSLLILISLLSSCKNSNAQEDSIPFHETFTIASSLLSEIRTINVWIPEGYSNSNDSFPVLYMLDGGIKEDFPHIANTIEILIEQKKIAPLILVGIENTQRRRDLTGYTSVAKDKEIAPIVGGAEVFRNFICDELFSEINQRYRITDKRGIIGESLAGLFVTETLFLYPNLFDYYIAFDPSLWWNNSHLLKTAQQHLNDFPTTPIQFWFAGSNAKDISPQVKQLAKILEGARMSNLKWKFSDEPKEKHSTIFRATKEKALIWILGLHNN